ncbi:MAG: nucleotidyltransferase domain-containing protein [Armatimonadetes bacterium]|nr:nucleotidyltransferase domain-containing protein [Armatimonadota bacterium]
MIHLEEIKNIEPVDRQLLTDLKSLVLSRIPDATLMLYGSVARGEQTPESDYDILILLHTPITREQKANIRNIIYDLELQHNVVMSIIFYTEDEWNSPLVAISPYRRNVEIDGILI